LHQFNTTEKKKHTKKTLQHKGPQKQKLLKKRPNTNAPKTKTFEKTAQHKRLLPQYAERSKKNGEKGSIEWG
jgi:hypothetical protein